MISNHRSTNKVIALFIFVASLVLYMLTMAPTASFWDAGEFIAVAHGLQVTHPPGAPLYSLVGRLFSMFMPANWVAVSINFISALASALTVMLLYLIVVRLVREFRGYNTDDYPAIDRIGMYGGGLIGAFTFAVTDTFWFNAVEAEVYALSMFFTAIVVWLALKWAENHDKPNNERWLLLIAYMFGLALGVHLLNLLALFFVALIIYFKKKEFGLVSLAITAGIAVVSFFLIYPFTVQWLPSIMDSVRESSYGLIGPIAFIILIVALLGGGIYFTHKKGHRLANLILLGYTMILIGYSSYSLIFIRSLADPPIDENDPETAQSFIDYLERKQYGQTPLLSGQTYDEETGRVNKQTLFPRRYSSMPRHIRQYRQYDSDWEFFLDYQVNHMYIRYFNWNFIGRESDIQDAGWQAGFTESEHEQNPAHNSYYYIPFLIGLLGMVFHFQRDWKHALSILLLFIMTGLAIIVFLNQTPMQPRERDYAYVGSFFAFAIWIGMGGVSLIEMVKEYLKSSQLAAYALLGVLFLAVPFQMGWQNYNDHDRGERYVAPDYAHNLLQSVDYQGILFTNGDNDTFPLWYLQEVEGVRTDVRVVNLSLLNTEWYIKQLRNQWSHESAPLPISLTNKEIEELTSGYTLHQPDTLHIPVNKDLLRGAFTDSAEYREAIGVKTDTSLNIFRERVDFGMPVDSLDSEVAWYYKGRSAGTDRQGNKRYYMQVQDKVILDILQTNKWLRPVYFANTVSRTSQMNLQNYFRFEGKAFRVVPDRHKNVGIFGWMDPEIMADTYRKFRFRKWNEEGNYLDENIRRMLGNYRYGVTELANKFLEENKPDSAAKWLAWGEKNLPFNFKYGSNNRSILLYAYTYAEAGDLKNALQMANEARKNSVSTLRERMQQYDNLQGRIMQLQQEAKRARGNANMEEQKQLQKKAQSLASNRKNIVRNIYSSISNLIIIQRIYYMSDKVGKAKELISTINQITGSRIEFPQNKEQNKKRIEQLM